MAAQPLNGLDTAAYSVRWRGLERFVVLQTPFDGGAGFVATWRAWQADPHRCARLWFVAIAAEAPDPASLSPELQPAWPPAAPGMHRLAFDGGRVVLQLLFAETTQALKQLRLQADAICVAGMPIDRHAARRLARLAAQNACLAVAHAASADAAGGVAGALAAAGFAVEPTAADAPMTKATFAPAFAPRRAPAMHSPQASREVLVIGAGLAGAACAHALARQGFDVTVCERHAAPACEASGNPGGLFHGIVNPQDGMHARFNRSAALLAAREYAPHIHSGRVPGRIDGLLRLQAEAPDLHRMQAMLQALGLPGAYVQALDAAQAAGRGGVPFAGPAWAYTQGGWLEPAALVRHWLQHPQICLRTGATVHSIHHDHSLWRVFDAQGRLLAQAPSLVLANAEHALRLVGADWPLERQRGQLTRVPADTPGLVAPRCPLAGSGYALTLNDGSVLCGATSHPGDADPSLRTADHEQNLDRLHRLTGSRPRIAAAALGGRTAWRLVAGDRLPVVGAVPLDLHANADQPRHVVRRPGLYVCTALGSRGITWAPLLGEVLASWVSGAPMPLEAALVDAIDPARFQVRRVRKSAF
jgi:tRNA 5-methylaminomethyl-2-thiouridine biosynthesis bifunctional protein